MAVLPLPRLRRQQPGRLGIPSPRIALTDLRRRFAQRELEEVCAPLFERDSLLNHLIIESGEQLCQMLFIARDLTQARRCLRESRNFLPVLAEVKSDFRILRDNDRHDLDAQLPRLCGVGLLSTVLSFSHKLLLLGWGRSRGRRSSIPPLD